MKRLCCLGFLFLGSALLVSPSPAFAGEVKVVDFLGLIRAVKTVSGKAEIHISVRRASPSAESPDLPLLTTTTGIAADIAAEQIAENKFVFRNVGDGTWRIRLRDKNLTLDTVDISDEAGVS